MRRWDSGCDRRHEGLCRTTRLRGPGVATLQGMNTLSLRQTITIRRNADDVFTLLTDIDRAPRWRADLVESTQTTEGPLRSGSVVREVSHVLGKRIVTESLVGVFRRPRQLSAVFLVGPMPVTREFTCVEWPTGTEVVYAVTAQLRGNWAMFRPYLHRYFRRTMAQSLLRLRVEAEAAPIEALVDAR